MTREAANISRPYPDSSRENQSSMGLSRNHSFSDLLQIRLPRRDLLKLIPFAFAAALGLKARRAQAQTESALQQPPVETEPSEAPAPAVDSPALATGPDKGSGVDETVLQEAPGSTRVDLSPQNIEAVMATFPKPVFFGSYPDQDKEYEEKVATKVWLWYQAVAKIHGGEIARQAQQLNDKISSTSPYRRIGSYGEVNNGLVAPISFESWPAITNKDPNIQLTNGIDNTGVSDNGHFKFRSFVVVTSSQTPEPNDIGALSQMIYANEGMDIAARVAGDVVGKQGIKDPEQLRILFADPKSEPKKQIILWTWRTVLDRVANMLEANPNEWRIDGNFEKLYRGYITRKGDQTAVDQYIKDSFNLN